MNEPAAGVPTSHPQLTVRVGGHRGRVLGCVTPVGAVPEAEGQVWKPQKLLEELNGVRLLQKAQGDSVTRKCLFASAFMAEKEVLCPRTVPLHQVRAGELGLSAVRADTGPARRRGLRVSPSPEVALQTDVGSAGLPPGETTVPLCPRGQAFTREGLRKHRAVCSDSEGPVAGGPAREQPLTRRQGFRVRAPLAPSASLAFRLPRGGASSPFLAPQVV